MVHESQKCILEQKFVVPSTYNMLPLHSALKILSPPHYNMKKREEVQYINGPGRRKVRRIASTGEFGKTGRGRSMTRAMKKSIRKENPNITTSDSTKEDSTMSEIFLPIVGPSPKKRKVHPFKICGLTGRNAATCPGKYIIGCDPAIECGLNHKINMDSGYTIPKSEPMFSRK
jgi:hypothetical protein